MTDKEIIINGMDVSECECIIEDYQQANNFKGGYEHIKNVCELGERGSEYYNLFCKDNPNCKYKQLKRKENELEELRQYHNKCCEEFKKEKQDLIDKYNQLSINFYNGDYCNTEHCSLLKSKEKECERLEQTLIQIKDIAENVQSFVGRINIEDDVFEQMEQILQKISECKGEYNEKIR